MKIKLKSYTQYQTFKEFQLEVNYHDINFTIMENGRWQVETDGATVEEINEAEKWIKEHMGVLL